ncbi:hypothetical protein [Sphingomonas rubra]|uniref:Lipoprotein n=1 Tax=Sphingomonas rubra TaxID=634430 RepID=A0A1I5PVI7_9SPHN|nr:hypothetical protein [Sphingomonas rubra]SFP38035.1 hypothetical protein SAMN04488241_101261 [Sphingomonas rubra]
MRWMIVAALVLAGCSNRHAEEDAAATASPETLATTAAQRILASAPKSLGGGVTITGAKADGRVLVMALSGMTDWRGDYSDAAMATTMSRAVCFEPGVDALVKAKGSVRLESRTAAGVNLPPLAITRC